MRFESFEDFERHTSGLYPEKKKGDFFEKFCEFYFLYNRNLFQAEHVYPQGSIPKSIRDKLSLEANDYGVDGVIVRFNGTIVAYQAKFRSGRVSPTVRELATFWAEAEKADEKLVISNCNSLPTQAGKHGISVLGGELGAVDSAFFEALENFLDGHEYKTPPKLAPHGYQTEMVNAVLEGFENHAKGKLIAACGTGKTLVSLWISERLNASNVVFLAPSLALIKQTLDSWSANSNTPFNFLAVCSDQTVVADHYDYADYSPEDVGFSVTTNSDEIKKFIDAADSQGRPKYIFCTYQSAEVLIDGLTKSDLKMFDLVLFDEAHKTAGASSVEYNNSILNDKKLKAKKKLFMTATERLVAPWLINKAAEAQRIVFSMDNEEIYGPTFFEYNFGNAIADKIIADYKIIISAVTSAEVARQVSQRQLVALDNDPKSKVFRADILFKQLMIKKAFKVKPISKVLTFHGTILRAKSFAMGTPGQCESLIEILGFDPSEFYVDYVDGSMSANERKRRLVEFSNSRQAVISNAKCLTEGVDVPVIDAVYFADSKTSLVDIVQACGRALRKPFGQAEKTAYIVVPVLIDDSGSVDEGDFKTVLKVVQALRSQDERLAQVIDKLNVSHVKGNNPVLPKGFIEFEWPEDINEEHFAAAIFLQILDGIAGPATESDIEAIGDRRAGSQKVLKVIGDYNPETMKDNLVLPTLIGVRDFVGNPTGSDLRFQNNNVAQTERLGLITQNDGFFSLTKSGEALLSGAQTFDETFIQACLEFQVETPTSPILPYKVILTTLLSLNSLTFPQFVFGPYSIKDGSESELQRAIENAMELKELYPRIEMLAPVNRAVVLADLNERFETSYALNEIWGSTTVKNRFGYFKTHLVLIDGVDADSKCLMLDPAKIDHLKTLIV